MSMLADNGAQTIAAYSQCYNECAVPCLLISIIIRQVGKDLLKVPSEDGDSLNKAKQAIEKGGNSHRSQKKSNDDGEKPIHIARLRFMDMNLSFHY
jgi:hypothetical protein